MLRSAARVSSWSCVLSASQNRTACKQLVASSTNENSQPPRASRAANRRSVLSPTHARRWGGLSRRADLRSFGFHGPSSSARISTPCRLSLTLGAWAWNGNPHASPHTPRNRRGRERPVRRNVVAQSNERVIRGPLQSPYRGQPRRWKIARPTIAPLESGRGLAAER